MKLRKTQAEKEAQEEKGEDEKRQNEKGWKEHFRCGVRGLRANSVLGFVHFLKKTEGFLVRRNSSESDQTGKSCLLTREKPR